MGSFRLGGMTFGSLFKKPETLLYPLEEKQPYPGQKGHVVNDAPACILCGMCQRTCPCKCITVDKPQRVWDIDPFMCIQCGTCVRACPTNSLSMEPTYTPVSSEKYDIKLDIPEKEKKDSSASDRS